MVRKYYTASYSHTEFEKECVILYNYHRRWPIEKSKGMIKMKKFVFSLTLTMTLILTSTGAMAGALKLGSKSHSVSDLQSRLADKGFFYNDITGYYGEKTKTAVENFQSYHGLKVDGIAGHNTFNKLYNFPKETVKSYTSDDVYWLSRLIEAEAQGEGYIGKVAVGNCVLNRVLSPQYPNNVVKVIFDTNYGVQYQPVANGKIHNTPSISSTQAAIAALEGAKPVGNSLFFYNPKKSTSSWIANNRKYYTTIGNHNFHL